MIFFARTWWNHKIHIEPIRIHTEPIRVVLWERKWEGGGRKRGSKEIRAAKKENKTSVGLPEASGDADGDGQRGVIISAPPPLPRSTNTQSQQTGIPTPCLGFCLGSAWVTEPPMKPHGAGPGPSKHLDLAQGPTLTTSSLVRRAVNLEEPGKSPISPVGGGYAVAKALAPLWRA